MTLRDRHERNLRQCFDTLLRRLGGEFYAFHGQGD